MYLYWTIRSALGRAVTAAIPRSPIAGWVLAFCALNALTFLGGAVDPWLDLISHLTPALLVGGLAVWGVAQLTAPRRVALAALLGAAAPPAAVIGPEVLAAIHAPAPREAATLKVLIFNTWSGNQDLEAVERLILEERADVVLLQESSGKGHAELLEHLSAVYPTDVSDYPNCFSRILSTLPLIAHDPIEGCSAVAARLAAPDELGGGEIIVASVHLPRSLQRGVSMRAIPTLRAHMAQWAMESAVVGGDFNRTSWSWALRRFDAIEGLSRRTRALPTWPAASVSVLPIDHAYATRDWRTVRVRRGPMTGSDHHPLIVEFARQAN